MNDRHEERHRAERSYRQERAAFVERLTAEADALLIPGLETENVVARFDMTPITDYRPDGCCACRWIVWNEDCGHRESDGIDSPHDHCELHRGNAR